MDKTERHFENKMSPASCSRYMAAPPGGLGQLLEAEVRERLVRFSHAVNFVTLLHSAAAHFCSFHQLAAQTLGHRLLAALVSGFAQPAHGQGHTTNWANFNWHLVIGTADAARFYLNHWFGVVDRRGEHFERILARLLLDVLESTVDDVFSDRLFAGQHQNVDEFGDILVTEFWIREDIALGYFTTTWHFNSFQSSVERGDAALAAGHHNRHLLDHYDRFNYSISEN